MPKLQQLDKLIRRQVCIPKDGPEQGFLDGLPLVNRHDGSSLRGGLDQYEVTPALPIFNKSCAL